MREDERENRARNQGFNSRGVEVVDEGNEIDVACEEFGTADRRVIYDINNPVMEPGSLYPSMIEFRLAMRQYAIDNEFELGIETTNKSRYRGYCKGIGLDEMGCEWSINAIRQLKDSPIVKVCAFL